MPPVLHNPRRRDRNAVGIGVSSSRIMIALGMTMLFAPCVSAGARHSEPSGREIYMAQCAGCHGDDGKGKPAAAGEPRDTPADLTALSMRNGGKFPAGRVMRILVGLQDIPAHHGAKPMPIWGDLFDARTNAAKRRARERLEILTTYLESIQQHSATARE